VGTDSFVNRVVAWFVAWIAAWSLWMFLVGEWNRVEWIAAAAAATVAATVGELARTRVGVHAVVPLRRLIRGWSALPMVFADFGIVMWALVRSAAERKVVRGAFRVDELDIVGASPASIGSRAWVTVLADYSPNAYVIDIDEESGVVLLHDLVPFRRSEEPA
jgi:hypothetical protein